MQNSVASNQNMVCGSGNTALRTQINCLDNTTVMTDDFTLIDVLKKLKDQVRMMATRVSQLDHYREFVNNPANTVTPQEVLKLKRNIINGLTNLLEQTKPLSYPCYQSLNSVKLLNTFKKVSSECLLLLNNIKHDNDNIIKCTERFKKLSIFMKDFQREVDDILADSSISTEIEQEVSREFKECKSDLYFLLSKLDPSSKLKQIMSLLVECNNQDEDAWVNIENMPELVSQCYQLKKKGFVLQNERNTNLFKLNI